MANIRANNKRLFKIGKYHRMTRKRIRSFDARG